MAENRWRAVVVIEGSPETSPNDFGKMWHAFRNEIDKGVDVALIEGSTGKLRSDPDVYRAEFIFRADSAEDAHKKATKAVRSAAQASSLPDDYPMVAPSYIVAPSVYEWPEGLPLI